MILSGVKENKSTFEILIVIYWNGLPNSVDRKEKQEGMPTNVNMRCFEYPEAKIQYVFKIIL